jgi:hypothetical protein
MIHGQQAKACVETLRGLAAKGLTMQQAADRMGITKNSVIGYSHRNNILFTPARKGARPRAARPVEAAKPMPEAVPANWTAEGVARLRKLAAAGVTQAEAAREFGKSRRAISNVACRLGIEFLWHRRAAASKRPAAVSGPVVAHLASMPNPVREAEAKKAAKSLRKGMAAATEIAEQSPVPAHLRPLKGCCFPLFRDGAKPGPNALFCDAPRAAGRSYCAAHTAVAFQRRAVPEAA